MQVALTTLRAALSDKLGCVLTPELVAEIVFRTAKEALDHHAAPATPEPMESR